MAASYPAARWLYEKLFSAPKGPFRIAYLHAPPHQYIRDGTPAGPAIEILREAARRKGIRLTWIPAAGSPDQQLGSGNVDLWPLVIPIPERSSRFHITEPWLRYEAWIISLEGRDIPTLAGRTLALGKTLVSDLILSRHLPEARPLVKPNARAMLEAVCTGEADAALMPSAIGQRALLNRPKSCNDAALTVAKVPGADFKLGLGASHRTPGARQAADAIRTAIGELARDGTLMTINSRWYLSAVSEITAMSDLAEARRRLWIMIAATSFLCMAVAGLLWQTGRLRRARRAAMAASAAKSEFLANISHEIRTPMNGVLGMLALAAATESADESRRHIATAQSSAESLKLLLDDILDLSKIEARRQELRAVRFNPRRLVESAVSTYRMQAEQQRLDLSAGDLSRLPPALVGDPLKLGQVIANLLSNALKFTECGGISVGAEVETREERHVVLKFSVSDSGIGIPESRRDLIFEPFRQADGSITRKYGGIGLGLTISARLVGLMGGRIWAESVEGQGSTFRFTTRLEIAEDEHAADPAQETSAPERPREAAPLGILLAEDNPVNRKIAVRMLERRGHSVTTSENGSEAVALASDRRFDVILMDVQMPVMDGLEATRLIREREKRDGKRVPIIAVTAHAMKGDRERCLDAGMDAYVSKPIHAAELIQTVETLASRA